MTEPAPIEETATQAHERLRLPLSPMSGDRVRPWSAGATVVSAVALILAAQWGYAALLGTMCVLALGVVTGWPLLGGSHTPTASSIVLALAAVAILGATAASDARWVAAAAAFGVFASFFHQLLRPPPREGLVLSLVAAFGALVILVSGALLVVLGHDASSRPVLVVGLIAAAVGVVGDVLVPVPRIGPFLGLIVLLLGVGAAALAGDWSDEITAWGAVGIGAATATVPWSLRRVFSLEPALLGIRGQLALGVGSVLLTGAVLRLFALLG